jgi:aspartokinase
MTALVLADEMVQKFGGDSVADVRANYLAYLDRIKRSWQ